mmetsp:Transcript_39342/g.102010  ORF Transcript_39342/g.102010 Transcript_39342/m.102010 type:complete len:231 (+) Transcript_39342:650-1342(+)
MPFAAMLWAVPGLEDPVLGRDGSLEDEESELEKSASAFVAVIPNVGFSTAGSSSSAGISGLGWSSTYSRDSKEAKMGSNDPSFEGRGFPLNNNSLSETRPFSFARESACSKRLPERSKISREGQAETRSSVTTSRWLSAKFSSMTCSIVGSFRSASAVSVLSDTSSVDRLGMVADEPTWRKERLTNWLPDKRSSSSLPKPFKCSERICCNLLLLAAKLSKLLRPAKPSKS